MSINKLKFIIAISISSVFVFITTSAGQVEAPDRSTTFRIGGHYTALNDYYKKAGEFYLGQEDPFPEFGIDLFSSNNSGNLIFSGDYFDKKNMFGRLKFSTSDNVKGSVSYRSFFRNHGTDLLENLVVRETTNPDANTPGGKMVTHEDTAAEADYGYTRHEIDSNIEFKIPLDEKHALKLMAAHRLIIHKGTEQKLAIMHCSSCHIKSQQVDVDRETNNISLDAQTKFDEIELGYGIDYSHFDSDVKIPEVFYDTVQHPVNGGALEEFDSRTNYGGEDVSFDREPEIEKISHRVNLKIPAGKGYLAGAFIASSVKNKWNNLQAKSNGGLLKYNVRFSSKVRLIANLRINRIKNDEVLIDMPLWREGLLGGGQDLDYTRYSNLTRTVLAGDANLKYRLNRYNNLSLQIGYERVQRDDYPDYNFKNKTSKIYSELKFKYRLSKSSTLRAKYRFTNIDNPFTIFNQLLEARGNGTTSPLPDNSAVYYFQRDDLRYGNAANQPALKHHLDLSVDFKPIKRLSLNGGVKYTLEQNGDLDTFDYERTTLTPNLSFNLAGGPRWSFFGGGSLLKQTANAPAAFAMFDG